VTAGTPADLLEAIDRAPDDERVLLELRLRWPALDDARARVAARLRVFLLTWDPLDWHDQPVARATATGDGDGFEVVLYVPLEQIVQPAAAGEEIAVVLGDIAASVLSVGAAYEQALVAGIYPQLAAAGDAPRLLSRTGELSDLPPPALALAAPDWEPIGLGAIQDLVQEAFGPVDLDRSPVRLAAAARPVATCPACGDQAFGFPADLADARPAMCRPHAAQAQEIVDERLARAADSNRDGMDAILGTSDLLSEPTHGLTLAQLRRLDDVARRRADRVVTRAELAGDAELACSMAARLTGAPERFAALRDSDRLPADWMVELPMALAGGGLIDEGVAVGDAFTALDRDNADLYADDVAIILAQAGRAEAALRRAQENVARKPRGVWTHLHKATVHSELGDPQQAEATLRTALALARGQGDAADLATVWHRLGELLESLPGREAEADEALEEAERWGDAAYGATRISTKVGRNDPCPCGSGRKHKRCCGA
jgi:tetratricopeptide (TPR) repeat protein